MYILLLSIEIYVHESYFNLVCERWATPRYVTTKRYVVAVAVCVFRDNYMFVRVRACLCARMSFACEGRVWRCENEAAVAPDCVALVGRTPPSTRFSFAARARFRLRLMLRRGKNCDCGGDGRLHL